MALSRDSRSPKWHTYVPNTKEECWPLDCDGGFSLFKQVVYLVTTVIYKLATSAF
jgi:hypothetical protein